MDLLIKWNANVNHQTKNGNTPLMKAAINGHVECVKILLEKGANVDKKKTRRMRLPKCNAKAH